VPYRIVMRTCCCAGGEWVRDEPVFGVLGQGVVAEAYDFFASHCSKQDRFAHKAVSLSILFMDAFKPRFHLRICWHTQRTRRSPHFSLTYTDVKTQVADGACG
jgi:hypothetical protein